MEGADIYQIAKNCRTSVEMIEKFHASHIKTTLDAAAINVHKARPAKKGEAQTGRPLVDVDACTFYCRMPAAIL
jgi:hypothetical protein